MLVWFVAQRIRRVLRLLAHTHHTPHHTTPQTLNRERDEFVQRMLEKEDGKTKKLGGGLTAEQIRELATTGAVTKDVRIA